MNTRTISIGLVGGALAAFALNLPLHRIQPAAYIPGWEAIPGYLGWAGYACAGLLVVLAGYCASRVSWAAKPLRVGALTGALAGLIAFLLSGASAAGLSGSAASLQYSSQSINIYYLLAEVTTRVAWYTYFTLAVLVVSGALLGMLGAGLHLIQGGDYWLDKPQSYNPGTRFLFSLTLFLVSGMTYLILEALLAANPEIGEFSNLEVLLLNRVRLPIAGIWLWPKTITLAVMVLALWHTIQPIARWLRHPAEHVRKSARLIAVLAAVFGLVVFIFTFQAIPNLERILITALLMLTGSIAAAAARKIPVNTQSPFLPSLNFRDLLQGLLLTPLLAAQVLVGGGVSVWHAIQINVIPFIRSAMGGTNIDVVANANTYFILHIEIVITAILVSALSWVLIIWPIGWLFSRATEKRFYPDDEDEE
ncbi:MAG: hypothetical protein JXB38_05810 [Anaerolineales bacterium]|nr:hypothetical protein [Anaerolineales bacterium]